MTYAIINLHYSEQWQASVCDVRSKPSALSMNYTSIEHEGRGLHPKHVADEGKK